MKKTTPIIIGGLVLIGLIVYFALYQTKYFNWDPKFQENGKEPYDTKVLYSLLEANFDLQPFEGRVTDELSREEADAKGTSYLYIGNYPKYTESEAFHLKQYVLAGGEAFLITANIPDSLSQFLFETTDCGSETQWRGQNMPTYAPKVYAGLTHPSVNEDLYPYSYYRNNLPTSNNWRYIPDDVFCDSEDRLYPIARLGNYRVDNKVYANFVKVDVGEGSFYFHTNPVMFTNFFMTADDTTGVEYAQHVFAHVSNDKLYWDSKSRLSPKQEKDNRRIRPTGPVKSPLEYIFSQRALRSSWYLFLALSFIYVFFRAKRRQRRIPILEKNRNTSLEFVETIGTLYFQQQDHKGILKKQMHLFLGHLRQRYHLVTRDLDEKLIDRIVVRSRVDRGIVQDIFNEYFKLRPHLSNPHKKVSAEVLSNFYLLVERFHKAEEKNKFEKAAE
jgi:hypothetical protein